MRAAWFSRQGAPDVIEAGALPTSHAGPGEVRVALHASGVNPADTNRRAGRGYAMEAPVIVPNSDGAGVVDEVGAGVDRAWLGKRVWLYNGQRGGRVLGTAAEYIALDVDLVSELADGTSFEEGACLGIPCMTAHRCVALGGDLRGKTVLVTGGAGAVGHYAIQWAKSLNARVIATVSSADKAAHALAAGADATIDYRREDVAAGVRAFDPAGVDHVVDVDFGGNLPTILPLLKLDGSIAFYASKGDLTPAIPAGELMRRNISIHGMVLNVVHIAARRRAQADIVAALRAGTLKNTVAGIFALERCADAHEAVEADTKRGTVVVRCR